MNARFSPTNRAAMERRIRACELAERIKPSTPPAPVTPDPYRLDDPIPVLREVREPLPIEYAGPEPEFIASAESIKSVAIWATAVIAALVAVVTMGGPELSALLHWLVA